MTASHSPGSPKSVVVMIVSGNAEGVTTVVNPDLVHLTSVHDGRVGGVRELDLME
jgi:hypothetical protein